MSKTLKRIMALVMILFLSTAAAEEIRQEDESMANYREDIVNIELSTGLIYRSFMKKSIGEGDNKADRFGVRAYRNGVPENLSGTCSGLFIRADGATVPVTDGAVSGNMAYVILPESCYAVEGCFCLAIKLTTAGGKITLRIVDGMVSRTSTDVAVDPGTIIPSIETLIDMIQETVQTIPSDYSALSGEVDYLGNNTFMPAENLYNYASITKGVVIKVDGSLYEDELGYTSDYIKVKEETEYYKRYVFGSNVVANVSFYNESKNHIESEGGSSHTFTTPENCAYIRICGYLTEAASECVYEGDSFDEHRFYRYVLLPSSGGASTAFMYASFPIIFDSDNSAIKLFGGTSGTHRIYMHIPGIGSRAYDWPISVTGTGAYLFYNYETEQFLLGTAEHPDSKVAYLISTLANRAAGNMEAEAEGLFFASGSPLMTIDTIGKKIYVNVPNPAYTWYKGRFETMTSESYALQLGDGVNCIFYNLLTKKFSVTQYFEQHATDMNYVNVGVIYNSNIQTIVPYALKETDKHLYGKSIVTYGDSLTWYDGQQFTWGDHQGEVCYGYQSYLKKYLGASITNKGASGSSTQEFVEDVLLNDGTVIAASDYVIIMPSIMNDDRLEVSPGTPQPIGGTFDQTTTSGALQTAIEYIYSVNQDARIVIMVEPKGWTYRDNAPHLCNELLAEAIRNVAKIYSLPIIDLWNNSGINELTRNTFLADPTFEDGNTLYMYHPNNDGWKVLSRIICEEMNKF